MLIFREPVIQTPVLPGCLQGKKARQAQAGGTKSHASQGCWAVDQSNKIVLDLATIPSEETRMRKALLATAALPIIAASPAMPQQKTIKIGFISTFSGPVAAIGNDMRNAFELGLDHNGRKLGGLPVEVIYEDDLFKPEVGVQKTQKLIESDKVDFIVGYIWSNVLLASLKPAVDSRTFLISANAGPSQVAGDLCSPFFFSTSWQNDQPPQAIGEYMNQKGVKTAFLIGPDYAGGKDMLNGVRKAFKGQIVGEAYTKWP